ncbi:carbohydrate binding domain-containing protein [Dokdonia sp.]|uniref:carbohydrate binding domain-containing protein n=1 Tax=Dokdonia sp. TaxID=2024995 RepID=UPI0032668C6B
MKKITLLLFFALLGGVTMQSQNLLSNGDFEGGMTVWEGNGFNVQTDGGNSFNFVDVATAGNPFDVNLSQRGLDIAEGQTFTLTFDASTDATTASRTMLAGIGLFVDPFTNQSMEVTVTETTQTFSLELVANFSSADSRVLFDMGAATGIVVIDNVSLTLNDTPPSGDNLLSNGDFEEGMTVWEGNGFNVQTDGGNSFNFVDVASAGEPFAVNLSQRGINITEGQTFTLTFDASTDATTASRTMLAGIGLFVDPFTNQSMEVTVTETTQTFSLELVANFTSADSRVLFDMGAATGIVVIDNVTLVLNEEMNNEGELLSNGDFEQGMVTWFGNAFNVQTDGGNSFNLSDNEVSGNPFDVNLSHPVALEAGVAYTFSFDASTSMEDGSRTIIAGIGLNEGDFAAATETVTITSDMQTFTFTLTPPSGSANSRALFDLGADDGVLVIDNVSLTLADGGEDPVLPAVAAPTPPARAVEAVFSIFSDAYTDQPDVVFGAFGVGTQDIETIQIEGDNTQQIGTNQPAAEFLLVDWGVLVDNTAMTHFHMDYWIDTDISTGLIANPLWSNHVGDAGETSSFGLTNPVTTFGEWVSVDVPLSSFDFGNNSNDQQRDALRQFVLTLSGADGGNRTIFLDNIYLHNNTTLGTEEFSNINVSVYPNPTAERWTVTTNSNIITSIAVYDMLGRRVSIATPNATTFDINASNLRTGIYIATVTTPEGQNTIKLIKQ